MTDELTQPECWCDGVQTAHLHQPGNCPTPPVSPRSSPVVWPVVWPVGTKALVRGIPAVVAAVDQRGETRVYDFRDEDGHFLISLTETSRWWCSRDD